MGSSWATNEERCRGQGLGLQELVSFCAFPLRLTTTTTNLGLRDPTKNT